jgi:hypothetical protein
MVMDGRNKDWWLGYFIGALRAIAMLPENTPSVKIQALKALQEYEEWESHAKEESHG